MDENSQFPPAGQPQPNKQKNTGVAIVAYLLFFVPLLTDAKNDPFVKFHVKQGLVLFIGWFVVAIVSWMPIFFWISWILNLALIVLVIIGIMNASKGKEEPLPLVGRFAQHFKF